MIIHNQKDLRATNLISRSFMFRGIRSSLYVLPFDFGEDGLTAQHSMLTGYRVRGTLLIDSHRLN